MVVPHSRVKSFGLRIPFAGIIVSILLFMVGTCYVAASSVRTIEYYTMKEQLTLLSSHVQEMNSTIHSLKRAEVQFRKLFSLKSKKEVIETFQVEDAGSLDMEALKKQIEESMESVSDIRTYIAAQKDIYLATPAGWPVPGRISSGYGDREHPMSGDLKFHSGIDISIPRGTKVKTTADGIASYSGWSAGSGNTVVIEHGHGFSTAYAHNERNLVKIGQKVKRGDVIAVSGSTGISTGPHIHYEIWKSGRHVNPKDYLARG
jgi:murein DD-endopeptidase MepM/ murein hydrolase activator NlpD